MEAEEFIRRVEIFKYLDDTALGHLASKLELVSLTEGPLMTEADPVDCLYIIKSGAARVTKVTDSGQEVVLAELKRGDSFGELALIDHAPRSATVEALTRGELLEFDAEALESLMTHSNDLRLKLLSNLVRDLAAKLRRTNDRLVHLL